MNVVKRSKQDWTKLSKYKNDFIKKNISTGIRGPTLLPSRAFSSHLHTSSSLKAPRYQFGNNGMVSAEPKGNPMGPPLEPPRSLKRKYIIIPSRFASSSYSKPESSSSGQPLVRVLASDSAQDTSQDFHTPRNRPSAMRYISSSSRGGQSGTRSGRSSSSIVQPSVILAISEGRGLARGEIGIAAVDLRRPSLALCQFSDTLLYTHTITKINFFNPIEIIVPHTFCEGVQPNQLYQLIKEHYPLLNLTTVQRRHFNDSAGRQQIQTLCAPEYSAVYLQVLHKFYALTSAAAVLKYVEYIQCVVFARGSLKVEYYSSQNTMIIDVGTATQLELVQPLVPSAGATCCLLGVLGPTHTAPGVRALRASILQPSCNKDLIENKLDAVQDLIENDQGLLSGLQDVIRKLSDIDRILLLCIESPLQNPEKLGEAQLNQVILLKTTMELVPRLAAAIEVAQCGRLKKIKLDFENPKYKEITTRIRQIIQDDAHMEKGAMGSLQRCFAVKPDINGLLDVSRRTYSELIDDIQKMVEQLSENHDIPLRLHQNVTKGFHIIMPLAPKSRRCFDVESLPQIFIQVHFNGTSASMTTEELVILDQQAKESLNEIQKMSNIVISELLKNLRPFMSSLYTLCENVAELDILIALAHASTVGSYVRPEFSSYTEVRNCVHPLLDYNSQTIPVPNDISASLEHNFTIITGPNMGGKSIYIKQIAVLQIMAQLGCFVPATNAVFRLADRIFSRIGFNDSVELNASTFVYEMKETQHILKGLTPSSLVIIDELCRGTSTDEGTSIAWAICEKLLSSQAFTFFTTHFMYLTRLQELYFNVVNLHTTVTEERKINESLSQNSQRRLIYHHKIVPGSTKVQHYGLALAANTNLPQETVRLAEELVGIISENTSVQELQSPQDNEDRLLYELNAQVQNISRKSNNVDAEIQNLYKKFKTDNPYLIKRLYSERNKITNNKNSSTRSIINSKDTTINTNIIENTKSTVNISYKNLTLTNYIQPEAVYSTSSDQDEGINLENIQTSCIKSSSELLHTLFNRNNSVEEYGKITEIFNDNNNNISHNSEIEKDNSNKNKLDTDILSDTSSPLNISIETDLNILPDIDSRNSKTAEDNSLSMYNSNRNEFNNDILSDTSSRLNNSKILDLNISPDIENSIDSDSDLAEAMTQIIKCSLDNQVCETNEDLSEDEELMRETVDELNEELLNMNELIECVLTPPMEFRD